MDLGVTSIQNQFFHRHRKTMLFPVQYFQAVLGEMLGCKASSVRMYLTRAWRKAMELILEVK